MLSVSKAVCQGRRSGIPETEPGSTTGPVLPHLHTPGLGAHMAYLSLKPAGLGGNKEKAGKNLSIFKRLTAEEK